MNVPVLTAHDLKRQLGEFLARDLDGVNEILARHLHSSSPFVADVTRHVSRFRGKQIRPILLLLTERMLQPQSSATALTLAAAIEMIHTATLVHDDVIDGATTRRHVATVHERWNTDTSVLLGDYLFSKAFHLTASTGDAEACRLIGVATDRTCEGEMNQSAARLSESLSEVEYFRIIRDKTSRLFSVSCLLGARTAQAAPHQQRAAMRFGQRVGMAFQIADDILDLSGDAATTGKDAGNDLDNGRLTLPLLRAVQSCSGPERGELIELLSRTKSTSALSKHAAVEQGIASAAQTARQLVDRAVADLRHFPQDPARSLLESIAAVSIHRNA